MSDNAKATALNTLALLVASDVEPVLAEEELDKLLNLSRLADSAGRVVTDPEWEPTYDLNYAAWHGWTLKAAKATSRFDISGDGTSLSRSQVAAACRAQARYYRALLGGPVG